MRDRRRAERKGRRAETLAALSLRLKGYRILESRVRTPMGEIDLIALRRGVVVFIEVKARANMDDAIISVTPSNSRRVENAAGYWMARRPEYADHGWRYDIIAIAPGRWPHHIRDAWRPNFAA